jgi:hypothetical protein
MAAKKLKRPKVGSFELSAFFAVKDLRFCSVLSVNSVLKTAIGFGQGSIRRGQTLHFAIVFRKSC